MEYFRTVLGERNPELLQHHEQSVELHAIFYNLCHDPAGNVKMWLQLYKEYEWDINERGPFPFDHQNWVRENQDLYHGELTLLPWCFDFSLQLAQPTLLK